MEPRNKRDRKITFSRKRYILNPRNHSGAEGRITGTSEQYDDNP